MLPLLRSFEQEPVSLDRKVILLTPGKREEGHTFPSETWGWKGHVGRCGAKSFPGPKTIRQ